MDHDLTGCQHGAAGYARRVVTQTDLELRDGRTLHVYDTLADGADGSTPHPGRDLASAAADVTSVADALGIGRWLWEHT